jgi:hypothetical protein
LGKPLGTDEDADAADAAAAGGGGGGGGTLSRVLGNFDFTKV